MGCYLDEMYWRVSSLPELQHISDDQRHQLLKERLGRGYSARLALRCLLRGLCFGLLAAFVVMLVAVGVSAIPNAYTEVVIVVVSISIATLGLYQFNLIRIRIRGQLRIYLQAQREQGVRLPVCVNCGYAARDQQVTCPECGAAT